ncbi:MAG: hypothetical protein JW828_03615 [Sedimentisphaerales bacterium]|nr:hypothetical protein [Sedimentisphaerales bacterium]
MLEDVRMILNEPFHVQFFIFLGLSFFLGLLFIGLSAVFFSSRIQRHLKKNYYDQWKLSKGTSQERKRVVVPRDAFYNKIVKQQRKVHCWITYIWIAAVLIGGLLLYINKNT